jgi:hypothetical protein
MVSCCEPAAKSRGRRLRVLHLTYVDFLSRGTLRKFKGYANTPNVYRCGFTLAYFRHLTRTPMLSKTSLLASLLFLSLPLTAQQPQPQPGTAPPPAHSTTGPVSGKHYTNVDGNRVHAPMRAASAPFGSSAKCSDGTYSFSQHRSGTCSHHGGVALWLTH